MRSSLLVTAMAMQSNGPGPRGPGAAAATDTVIYSCGTPTCMATIYSTERTEVCPADQAPIVHRRNGAIVLRTWIPPTDQVDGRWIYDALWTD